MKKTKALRQKNKICYLPQRKFSIILGGCVLCLFVVSILLAIESGAKGARLYFIENEKAKIENENKLLSSFIVGNTALSKISESAKTLGMGKPDQIIYLNKDIPIARLP